MTLLGFLFCLRGDYDKYSEDPEFKPASRHTKEVYEEVRCVNRVVESGILGFLKFNKMMDILVCFLG